MIIKKLLKILSDTDYFQFNNTEIIKLSPEKYHVVSDLHLDNIPIIYCLSGLKYFINANKSEIDYFDRGAGYKSSNYKSTAKLSDKQKYEANNEALEAFYLAEDIKQADKINNSSPVKPEYFTYDFKLLSFTRKIQECLLMIKKDIELNIQLSFSRFTSSLVNSFNSIIAIILSFIFSSSLEANLKQSNISYPVSNNSSVYSFKVVSIILNTSVLLVYIINGKIFKNKA